MSFQMPVHGEDPLSFLQNLMPAQQAPAREERHIMPLGAIPLPFTPPPIGLPSLNRWRNAAALPNNVLINNHVVHGAGHLLGSNLGMVGIGGGACDVQANNQEFQGGLMDARVDGAPQEQSEIPPNMFTFL